MPRHYNPNKMVPRSAVRRRRVQWGPDAKRCIKDCHTKHCRNHSKEVIEEELKELALEEEDRKDLYYLYMVSCSMWKW